MLYNSYGYLCRLTDNGGSPTCTSSPDSHVLFTVNSRDAELHLTQSTQGNGVVTKQTFDPETGLITCTFTGSTCISTGTVASLGYQFDQIGNLTSRTDSNESFTERFCYDSLNRLTNYAIGASCTASGTKTVSYDSYAMGNIASKSDVGTYSYPTSGSSSVRPHAVSEFSALRAGAAASNEGAFSTWNTSITSSGSKYLNVQTNVNAASFQANLEANGYSVVNKAGGTTVLSNGSSTYSIYSRTSTGLPGAQYFGPDGSSIKYSLGGR